MRPLRVFLCHATQDKPAVRELYNALKSQGWVDPWLDKAKILPGQDWEMVIEKAVEASDVVVVCLSNQSVSKEGYVQREIRYAYDIALEKPEETIFLIPLRLENCTVPRKLKALHWVDYFGIDKENSYSDLLEALKLRHEQVLRLDAEELERRKNEEKAQQEVEELVRKFEAERIAWEQRKRKIPQLKERVAYPLPAIEENKGQVKKPFTKFLDPASLFPQKVLRTQSNIPTDKAKSQQKPLRWIELGVIILLALILGGFGLNYLIKNPPVVTVTVSPTDTATPKPPTSTKVSFAHAPTLTKTPIPTPTLGMGSTMIGEHGETLVYVPAGEFTMGNDNGESDEKPAHTVYLDAFWIDQTEVTNKQYQACVDAGMCEPPNFSSSNTHPSYYKNSEFDKYPVIYVSWDKANRYCEVWADGDLPTEAQWEKAARGTDGRAYPWGDSFDGTALNLNFCDVNCSFEWANKYFDDGYEDVSPVGNYSSGQSPYGVYDMAGNVWEWVNDWYDIYSSGDASASSDFGQKYRVLRGGSWDDNGNVARSASRDRYDPLNAFFNLGFRCVRSP